MWSSIAVLLIAAVGIRAQATTCICVHYRYCINNTINTDGTNILAERTAEEGCTCPVGQRARRMECLDRISVCCHKSEDTETDEPETVKPETVKPETEKPETVKPETVKPETEKPETVKPETEKSITDEAVTEEAETDEPETSSEEQELTWDDCGIKGYNPRDVTSKVLGDEGTMYTLDREFPWMAMVISKKDNKMVCGASILHHHVVMTAAHCVKNFQEPDLLVRVGVWDTGNLRDSVTVEVQRMFKHDQFGSGNYRNDIALLVLSEGLQISGAVAPICLPQPDTSYDNMLCWATGWGVSQYGQRNYSQTLKRVELKIIPRAQCQKELRKTKLGPFFKVHNSFVCAKGGNNLDTCIGDGGGPLVCLQPGTQHYVQVGIVATGLGCGDDIPALYANVPRLMPWIQAKFDEWNLKSYEF